MDKECKLGKAALYERDFKEGGMEIFVKLNPDGSVPIAADGWYSSWGAWQACSKTCAGGTRKRSKTYNPPVNGGLELVLTGGASSLESESCNVQNCPIDGGWSRWSCWGCTTCCGAGTATRARTCSSPRPQYGGKDCETDPQTGLRDEETGQTCNADKTCYSGTLSYANIYGSRMDEADTDGTSMAGYSHTLSSCAQV